MTDESVVYNLDLEKLNPQHPHIKGPETYRKRASHTGG